ncbi:MAG: helix-turn-helix transcriptional regulator [Ruminococcus sp.]|nr:helix-turn-helix transcriptional regulator [Ruminococcus sp.]
MITIMLKNLLEQKQITRYQLSQMTEIKYQTLDNYYKNRVTRYDGYILSKICKALDCEVGDILRYDEDEN